MHFESPAEFSPSAPNTQSSESLLCQLQGSCHLANSLGEKQSWPCNTYAWHMVPHSRCWKSSTTPDVAEAPPLSLIVESPKTRNSYWRTQKDRWKCACCRYVMVVQLRDSSVNDNKQEFRQDFMMAAQQEVENKLSLNLLQIYLSSCISEPLKLYPMS